MSPSSVGLLLALGASCAAAPPAPAPVAEEPPAMTALTQPLRTPLAPRITAALGALDGEVVPVEIVAASSFPAGGLEANTPAFGTLKFVRGDEETLVSFEQGQPFTIWGHQAAVYGDRAETLVIAPPGEAPSP